MAESAGARRNHCRWAEQVANGVARWRLAQFYKPSVQLLTHRQFHTADFCQALEATNQRIAGVAFTVLIVEQLMPMVRTQRQARAAFAFTSALFCHQGSDDPDHVDIAIQMVGFVEAARVSLAAG